MQKIYLLGKGKMAEAIAAGLDNSGFEYIYVSRRALEGAISYEDFSLDDKICILCFKPGNLAEISQRFINQRAKIIISPLAGVCMQQLACIAAEYHLRIMPNIAARFNNSSTTYFGDCKHPLHESALKIIRGFGSAIECESEKELDLAMAINGCAPAFLALVAEAIANGGTSIGLKNEKAHELSRALFSSFASLLAHAHPASIKEDVCSPAGVSIKGVNVLEQRAVRSAFIDAISKSAGL